MSFPRKNYRKKRSKLSSLGLDLKPVVRKLTKGQQDLHPEIWARWGEIVGANIAVRAVPIRLRKGVLTIGVANSSWMQELGFLRSAILERLREEVGQTVVREIQLILNSHLVRVRAIERDRESLSPISAPPVVVPESIENAVSSVCDEELKNSIRRAVRASLEAQRRRRREEAEGS